MNFYQSNVWKSITKDIYKKPTFEIDIGWETLLWIQKKIRKLWVELSWFQVLWANLYSFEELDNIRKIIVRDFWDKYSNIFFQLWFINNIKSWNFFYYFSKEYIEDVKSKRADISKNIIWNWFEKSFRENMPEATVYFDLNDWIDNIYKWFSKSSRNHINKWIKKWLYFIEANWEEYEKFYELWKETSCFKWFSIIDKDTFNNLIKYISVNNSWKLFLAKLEDEIVSWSLCLFEKDSIFYLYWATNRKFWNVWWHHFLKYEILKRWISNMYRYVDLLWVSPTWQLDHHLIWVTRFKESLWWYKIDYYWNYDIVLNPYLYKLFRFVRKIR